MALHSDSICTYCNDNDTNIDVLYEECPKKHRICWTCIEEESIKPINANSPKPWILCKICRNHYYYDLKDFFDCKENVSFVIRERRKAQDKYDVKKKQGVSLARQNSRQPLLSLNFSLPKCEKHKKDSERICECRTALCVNCINNPDHRDVHDSHMFYTVDTIIEDYSRYKKKMYQMVQEIQKGHMVLDKLSVNMAKFTKFSDILECLIVHDEETGIEINKYRNMNTDLNKLFDDMKQITEKYSQTDYIHKEDYAVDETDNFSMNPSSNGGQLQTSTKDLLCTMMEEIKMLKQSVAHLNENDKINQEKIESLETNVLKLCHENASSIKEVNTSQNAIKMLLNKLHKKISESPAIQREENNVGLEEQKLRSKAMKNDIRDSYMSTFSRSLTSSSNLPKIKPGPKKRQVACIVPAPLYGDERLSSVFEGLESRLSSKSRHFEVKIVSREPSHIEPHEWVLIPCINSSRVGSDVSVALSNAGLKSGMKATLLMFNHLAPHNSKILTPTSDKLRDSYIHERCTSIIDLIFWDGKMYDCEANHEGCREIVSALENALD